MSEETSQTNAAETQGNDTPSSTPSFAERLDRARKIVQLLEQGDVDLETGARLYKEASSCLKFCRERLENVRNEIELLNGEILKADDFLNAGAKDEVKF